MPVVPGSRSKSQRWKAEEMHNKKLDVTIIKSKGWKELIENLRASFLNQDKLRKREIKLLEGWKWELDSPFDLLKKKILKNIREVIR